MSNDLWNNYLASVGAEFSSAKDSKFITGFSGRSVDDLQAGFNCICPLVHMNLLSCTGPDSEKFLQGQLTCDLNLIKPEHSQLGAACTPGGRVYSSFRLIERAQHDPTQYLMRMRDDIISSTLTTLGKYIVFFKSEMADISDQWAGIGIIGDQCDDQLQELFGALPQTVNQVVQGDSGLLIRVPGEIVRYECWMVTEQAQMAWEKLSQAATPAGTNNWLLQDIENGIAEITQVNCEAFIPQMLNFQAIDAISFDKGCYTGQEIVARTQYRGRAKRLMVRAIAEEGPELNTGMEFTRPGENQHIATLVETARLPDGRQEVLMVVLADLASHDQWELCTEQTCFNAQLLPLPYHCAESQE